MNRLWIALCLFWMLAPNPSTAQRLPERCRDRVELARLQAETQYLQEHMSEAAQGGYAYRRVRFEQAQAGDRAAAREEVRCRRGLPARQR